MMTTTTRPSLLLLLVAALLFLSTPALGQFFNFFNQQGGQAREQEAPPSGDASWFEARTEASQCPHYLCPRTLSCVSHPSKCPCPFPQQKRCAYPDPVTGKLEDGGAFCVQQEEGCAKVEAARGQWWQWKELDKDLMKGL
ncbi:hypothetical protein BCV69DRAFT_280981 [Microstroma glucosiphilum]|uniref:Long chronological lifespan protein 2 n=1 Tax=Pseudomicrostroma glucosiphilum TaxID=1684307 RepID=A0A316UG77_9BASI|nr:hypothetical protein BCV69DRAFT_280981 [Pseudomicrostroma glucosiphilum]PWN23371.1 hypothetical protein BCV69DRAFT_280981 [Pseudomicrostroma glucosiphilum]